MSSPLLGRCASSRQAPLASWPCWTRSAGSPKQLKDKADFCIIHYAGKVRSKQGKCRPGPTFVGDSESCALRWGRGTVF